MKAGQGKRYKQFTRDTTLEMHHTYSGNVSLCRSLLRVSHDYALLGTFSTDHLDKEVGKWHQGSGGRYFITVPQIIVKVNISKASLLLLTNANISIDSSNIESGHFCFNCIVLLDKILAEIFDGLPELGSSVPEDTEMVVVYIASYITRNESASSEEKLVSETALNHQNYGTYLDAMDRDGLNIPTDNTCQWSIFILYFSMLLKRKCAESLFVICV